MRVELRNHVRASNVNKASGGKRDIGLYIISGTPQDIFAGMADISGHPPLLPKFSLGFLNTEWGTDQAELLNDVAMQYARFAATVIVSICAGIVISTSLGMIAYANGYNESLVWNISGLLSTVYVFGLLWMAPPAAA